MKPMLTGFAAIIVISVVAWYGLGQAGFSSSDVHSGPNVRID
ncbi:MAG: hypothetical protein OXC60_18020 [Litoreibacter sp.]|nr:hypothetical protein [Litoreibacter sp.]